MTTAPDALVSPVGGGVREVATSGFVRRGLDRRREQLVPGGLRGAPCRAHSVLQLGCAVGGSGHVSSIASRILWTIRAPASGAAEVWTAPAKWRSRGCACGSAGVADCARSIRGRHEPGCCLGVERDERCAWLVGVWPSTQQLFLRQRHTARAAQRDVADGSVGDRLVDPGSVDRHEAAPNPAGHGRPGWLFDAGGQVIGSELVIDAPEVDVLSAEDDLESVEPNSGVELDAPQFDSCRWIEADDLIGCEGVGRIDRAQDKGVGL